MNIMIIAAAVRNAGKIYTLPPPNRHHHIIETMPYPRDIGLDECGFMTNNEMFVTRKEALEIARNAKQIVKRCGGDEHQLYSENLW